MQNKFGASLVIATTKNHRGEYVFPMVYSEKKELACRTMYWKFPAGKIESIDFPAGFPVSFNESTIKQAAMNAAIREFCEETSISREAIDEIQLVRAIDKRTHMLYAHLCTLHHGFTLPPAGRVGVTGDRLGYFTANEIYRGDDFMPSHRSLLISITGKK